MKAGLRGGRVGLVALAGLMALQGNAQSSSETPASLVAALHGAFGDHHARAVHSNGLVLEGTFDPAPDASTIVKTPVFSERAVPVVVRFSLFAGVPNLADNDDAAAPVGFGMKIKSPDGDDFDVEAFQHPDFITATADEFGVFLRALSATKPDSPHPTPLEQFLGTHPHARDFLQSRTYPASYAQARYFSPSSEKFTDRAGRSIFVRYELIPHSGESYLSPQERKAKSATYLRDDLIGRMKRGPIVFDWYAQVAEKGDAIADPSIAWPATRRLVKLGTITLTQIPSNAAAVDKALLLMPGRSHPGVEAADPMLKLRDDTHEISFAQRQ
jgi:catalase